LGGLLLYSGLVTIFAENCSSVVAANPQRKMNSA
jgi:hypothetical protein